MPQAYQSVKDVWCLGMYEGHDSHVELSANFGGLFGDVERLEAAPVLLWDVRWERPVEAALELWCACDMEGHKSLLDMHSREPPVPPAAYWGS